jgi:dTDP-4-dehydrorhamnose reductase
MSSIFTLPNPFPGKNRPKSDQLELWGGVECSCTRVHGQFIDQIQRSGHHLRIKDLELFAELGIRALRYPVLWERTAPYGIENADWRWSDERLNYLTRVGVHPIVGLVHHGSGPLATNLMEASFPERLADYAGAVARRYPWIKAYTPINEILTTARFSGLYGYWYPHEGSEAAFLRALMNQCRAVRLSMHAVRQVNPQASLVQTDDLGRTYSTPALSYQADFDNERRWLGWDLLCGRVDSKHPLWQHLRNNGISEQELAEFLESPCPPDVLGVNHYLTSDRFLDERLEHYPSQFHGGNGRHRYADVEAARVLQNFDGAQCERLMEAWERYHLPIAVTEVHLGCTREEQCRWLLEMWHAAHQARSGGADVRAVTVWSLLGAYDWSSLLTRSENHYESGAFDLRGGLPRATAVARLAKHLAAGEMPQDPIYHSPGWWRRSIRLLYPAVTLAETGPHCHGARSVEPLTTGDDRPLLITGAGGKLGRAFERLCHLRGLERVVLLRRDLDVASSEAIAAALDRYQPWAVINAAGFAGIDRAETERTDCFRANLEGPKRLAKACAERNIPLVSFSSALVFDGSQRRGYVESDGVKPLSTYGRSKAAAEKAVLQLHPTALIVRTSAFFGPWDDHNFLTSALRRLAAGETHLAANDAVVSPTYIPDLVHATLDLLIDGEKGLWHLANEGETDWYQFAKRAAGLAGVNTSGLIRGSTSELGFKAPRPSYSVLATERAALLPTLDEALRNYVKDRLDSGAAWC